VVFFLGGPIGAAAGAALGHFLVDAQEGGNTPPGYDLSVACPECGKTVYIRGAGRWRCPHCQEPFLYGQGEEGGPKDHQRRVFFVAVFSMLGKLAKADGRVTPDEIRAVDDFMVNALEMSPEDRRFAREIFRAAKNSSTPFAEYARQFYREVNGDRDLAVYILQALLEVALADGVLSKKEDRLLIQAAEIFGLQGVYEHMRGQRGGNGGDSTPSSQGSMSVNRAHELLGLPPSASQAEVKKAFKEKARQFHPDTISGKGLPQEFVEFANGKFQEIKEAYDLLRRS